MSTSDHIPSDDREWLDSQLASVDYTSANKLAEDRNRQVSENASASASASADDVLVSELDRQARMIIEMQHWAYELERSQRIWKSRAVTAYIGWAICVGGMLIIIAMLIRAL